MKIHSIVMLFPTLKILNSCCYSKVNSPQQAEIEVEENRLQGRFEDLIAAIEGYLGTIARQLEEALK